MHLCVFILLHTYILLLIFIPSHGHSFNYLTERSHISSQRSLDIQVGHWHFRAVNTMPGMFSQDASLPAPHAVSWVSYYRASHQEFHWLALTKLKDLISPPLVLFWKCSFCPSSLDHSLNSLFRICMFWNRAQLGLLTFWAFPQAVSLKLREARCKMVVARVWEEGTRGAAVYGVGRVSVVQAEKVLETAAPRHTHSKRYCAVRLKT